MNKIETAQRIINEIVDLATKQGCPPEMTHKSNLFDVSKFDYGTVATNVAGHLIEGYSSKSALAVVFAIAFCVMDEYRTEW
jgi:hypothetical protein